MENEIKTTKRKSKDSVFVNLFADTENVLKLYRDLHPDDIDITSEDISIKTLESVIVNTVYNDLGFLVKDKLIFLIEAQSIWNANITLRMLIYLAETYQRYLHDTEQSEHLSSRVKIPKPELYVVYSGNKNVPDEVSFSEDFFNGDSPVDIKVKVLHDTSNITIYGQYIGFCKVFDEQRKIYRNKIECIRETLRICAEKGYLVEFLKKHESEAVSMMSLLFDEEYQREQYDKAVRKAVRAEGIAEGITQARIDTAKKMLALKTISLEDIIKITGLSPDKIQELEKTIQ